MIVVCAAIPNAGSLSVAPWRRSQRLQVNQTGPLQDRSAPRKKSLPKGNEGAAQPPLKRVKRSKSSRSNAKPASAAKCQKLAEDIIEKVQIGLASPNEGQALASLPLESGEYWAIFIHSLENCFTCSIPSVLDQIKGGNIKNWCCVHYELQGPFRNLHRDSR